MDTEEINVPSTNQVLIRPNTVCPKCRGLILYLDNLYRCVECNTKYIPVGSGIKDDELLCDILE